jgi:hypothetical protein
VVNVTNIFLFIFWSGLAFKYLSNSLKSIRRLTVSLIDERTLICDHSQFVYI